MQNLRTTSLLSQELRSNVAEQINLLNRQFDFVDNSFPEQIRSLNYSLGQRQIEYLKLDIGEKERLTVERIRSLQAELATVSFQIFELLRSNNRKDAAIRLHALVDQQKEIDETFEELYWLQMNKLQSMHNQLDKSVFEAFFAAYSLTGGLIIVLCTFMFLFRKRVLKPLKSIYRATDKIRQGSFSARAPVDRVDEIGQLAQGFNFMAESLAESYASLEHRVEERTRQVKELQQQFVQAAKMSAVGQLISGVAHELNNPLTVIMGFTSLAEMELSTSGGEPRQIQLMRDLQFQADRCRKIVANLLQFARQVEPDFQLCRINELIEQILRLREYEFSTRNIKIVREYDAINPHLYADSNKLQQIVLNLLNNAYDAIRETGRGGTIWVRTKSLGESVLFEFLDNGTGISEPNRIFDPFYTTKEVGEGTGLGLSVCYGLVQEHRGNIKAENWSQGARFTVVLPIGTSKETLKPEAKMEERQIPEVKCHALIVDDEKMIISLQSYFLASMGIESTGVNTGEEAIKFLEENSAEIIISDVRMPGAVDGIRLYDWVVKNRTDLRDRFIFVTGDSIGLDTGQLFNDISVPRLVKPFKLQDYCHVIRRVLERKEELE